MRTLSEFCYDGPDTVFRGKLIYIYDTAGRLVYTLMSEGGVADTVERYRYSTGLVTTFDSLNRVQWETQTDAFGTGFRKFTYL